MSPVKSPKELRARDIGKKDKIVVEKPEEVELPQGWKKEVKVRKTGSATKLDKYYTDPVTGYIFRSLKDVQRYLKTGELGRLAIKPKDNDGVVIDNASNPSTGKKTIKVEQTEEKSESKEQMNETWRNKRPLENISGGYKTRSKPSESSKSELPHRASKRLAGVDIDTPPPPPPPSSPVPKTRHATKQAGIKIESPPPSPPDTRTSRHAPPRSPPDTRTSHHAPPTSPPDTKTSCHESTPSPLEPKTRHATRQAGIKIESPPPSPPDSRNSRQAKRVAGIEMVAFAAPPPETKTRQVKRVAGIETVASPLLSSPEPKTRQAKRVAEIETVASPPEPKTRHAKQAAATEINASPPDSKTHEDTLQSGIKVDSPPPSPLEPKTIKPTQLAGIEKVASPASPPQPKTQQAKRAAATEIVTSPPEPKTRRITRQSGIKIESPPPSPPDTRTSRQATRQTKVAEIVNFTTPKKNADMDNKQENSILSPPVNQDIQKNVNEDEFKNKNRKPSINLPPSTPKGQYNTTMPPVTHTTAARQPPPPPPTAVSPPPGFEKLKISPPPGFEKQKISPPPGFEKQQVSPPPGFEKQKVSPPPGFEKQNPPIINQPQITKPIDTKPPESSINFSLNNFWTDPCIEFAVKTLTGAIPFGDLNKPDTFTSPSLNAPMENLWTDPCIEFAVKTLTGALPVGKDDYLSQQTGTSSSSQRAIHDFSLPDVGVNFCQTEVLSTHFETGHNGNFNSNIINNNVNNKQQDSGVFMVGNGGLQKAGNMVNLQQVNGSNGQCSRSRLFQ